MEREHREVYYDHNRGWIFLGVLLSAAVLAAAFLIGRPALASLAALPPVLIGGGVLTVLGVNAAKSWGGGLAGKMKLAILGFIAVIALLNTGLLSAAAHVLALEDPLLIGAVATLILTNVLFFHLSGRRRRLARSARTRSRGCATICRWQRRRG